LREMSRVFAHKLYCIRARRQARQGREDNGTCTPLPADPPSVLSQQTTPEAMVEGTGALSGKFSPRDSEGHERRGLSAHQITVCNVYTLFDTIRTRTRSLPLFNKCISYHLSIPVPYSSVSSVQIRSATYGNTGPGLMLRHIHLVQLNLWHFSLRQPPPP
jgi:hypothetical protein